MTEILLPLATALASGFLHALEPDHVAAVTTFVARRPVAREAVGFGVRWAIGHTVSLAIASALLLGIGLRPSDAVGSVLEGAVGLLLVGLGARLLWSRRSARPPSGHGTTWVGAAHGLAGTGAFLALLPVALLGSAWLAAAYVVAFGVGTIVGMGTWGLASGLLLERVGGRVAEALTAAGSIAIGLLWVARAVG